jgi:hypothetical protein
MACKGREGAGQKVSVDISIPSNDRMQIAEEGKMGRSKRIS